MKKTYINPNIEVIDIDMKSAMLSTSEITVGDNWSSGDAAGRKNDGDDW